MLGSHSAVGWAKNQNKFHVPQVHFHYFFWIENAGGDGFDQFVMDIPSF